ncbi:bifunctional phosphopantothenoylcysteine decarboxylase/phosphopantothenate synthase [Halorhodospira halochloris]|uniref:bifunctional phosphopantothenoylcysteine decarboxylase/phosphopantothenate synthase n=1 Tax=Halorhodospira halochloris TaxID=1052 RepID=UPI001EE906F3|nr:bifunctional phosphopantothenoylcysteine decarboxylase/phosphopantothenate synthase [Halorhodospira halochloris]MCG5529789.1 bifunctional phosphopantothenoylcysteine decarboxylase/phosphopantothenate synthase [Halorhodospira halochloris]
MDREQKSLYRVLLIVSGGIAAYKSAELVRELRGRGCDVRVAMTSGAQHFITPLTLQALSGNRVHTELLDAEAEAGMGHIELARWAEQVLVAPATADFLARLAQGRADDLPAALCLATRCPIAVAPAMNNAMWEAPATRDNIVILQRRGVTFIGPVSGDQACGESGMGRMCEAREIAAALLSSGKQAGAAPPSAPASQDDTTDGAFDYLPLAGKAVMVTAGPTREPLDPVRYLTNRSSGRMGFAIAQAAHSAGARVILIAGPCALPTPAGVERHDVERASDMYSAVMARIDEADIFIGCAAVCDYRPIDEAHEKIKKGAQGIDLALVPTPDILRDVASRSPRPFVVGFAAETHDVQSHARGKLLAKNLDMIAANQVGDGQAFDVDENSLELLWDGGGKSLPQQPKHELALALIKVIVERMGLP